MSIGLVAYIPDKQVVGCIKDIVQSHGQFYHSETCPEMPLFSSHNIDDKGPELSSYLNKVLR
jgi:hypothetical protein